MTILYMQLFFYNFFTQKGTCISVILIIGLVYEKKKIMEALWCYKDMTSMVEQGRPYH